MAFVFDITCIKWNTILHVDSLIRLKFESKYIERSEKFEDTILHSIDTDVLPLNRCRLVTRQDPVLNRKYGKNKEKYIE